MKLTVQTLSGSIYGITDEKWERIGRVPIIGTDENDGPLTGIPTIIPGQSMSLPLSDGSMVRTTAVMRVEVLEQ